MIAPVKPLTAAGVLLVASGASAQTTFFNNGDVSLVLNNPAGVIEPGVPVFQNTLSLGTGRVIEAFDRVSNTPAFPLTFVDLIANTYLRATYQTAQGTTGTLGTSVVGAPSFRTASGLQFIPQVSRADVQTGGSPVYVNDLRGTYSGGASIVSTRTYASPPLERTGVGLDVRFDAPAPIALSSFGRGFDRFRLLTVSSMFASPTVFDADVIRYEDPAGVIRTIDIAPLKPTSGARHLFSQPIDVGGWIELVKSPGSSWQGESPTVRVDLLDRGGLRLGMQGFLISSTDPNDDSLTVWLEWLDAPDVLPASLAIDAAFRVTAIDPRWKPGDIDRDGSLDVDDIEQLLRSPSGAVGNNRARLDLNFDGTILTTPHVPGSDADYWVRTLREIEYGDTNLDGMVDFADLLTLAQNYGLISGRRWSDGSFDGDNAVDFDDLLVLAQHYGFGAEAGDVAHDWMVARTLVPEPSSTLGLLVSCVLLRRVRVGG
jgi:hypothetical protein